MQIHSQQISALRLSCFSNFFFQISEHLQYALSTTLLGQFIEVQKSLFFQRLENLVWDSISLFFLQHFEKFIVNLTA